MATNPAQQSSPTKLRNQPKAALTQCSDALTCVSVAAVSSHVISYDGCSRCLLNLTSAQKAPTGLRIRLVIGAHNKRALTPHCHNSRQVELGKIHHIALLLRKGKTIT